MLETANSFPWVDWREAADFVGFSFQNRLNFSDFNLMIQAAAQGHGCIATLSNPGTIAWPQESRADGHAS